MASSSRLLWLSGTGCLMVCTDLQGNLADFHAVEARFRHLLEREPDSHLLFCGDLVHGPEYEPEEWPDYLGTYYRDDSPGVMQALVALKSALPGRVHALLGNHEHAHVGGPVVGKFFEDEAAHLESKLGTEGALALRREIQGWPLAVVATNGGIFTHGAPAAAISGPEDFDVALLSGEEDTRPYDPAALLDAPEVRHLAPDYAGYEGVPLHLMPSTGLLGTLLWARSARPEVARRFIGALGGSFSVFGHDIVHEGYERTGAEQLCLSTSFGLFDENKMLLVLRLDRRYESALDLEPGREILRLYP
jgi:hypothetical protein